MQSDYPVFFKSLARIHLLEQVSAYYRRIHKQWLTRRQISLDAIFGALIKDIASWRKTAFAAAWRLFSQEAKKLKEDLHGTVFPVSRTTYCIRSILLDSETVLQKLVQFMGYCAFVGTASGQITIRTRCNKSHRSFIDQTYRIV
jgi:hypothetical protein